jgi:DNA polymerase-3 subunit alpha
MDYADNRRDEVIEYARQKYGADHVAQIGTFGTMMARGAVRDVARALGFPYTVGDRLSKLIPMGSQGFPMTLKHALEITPELKEAYEKETDAKEIIDLAKKLEGCVRHISVHAAGVVISPTALSDFTPIQFDPKGEKTGGKLITQYDMHAVEDVGLLKFDFLGIRNLAILADAIRLVKKYHNIDIDIQKIPRDDKKTFAMLAKGETAGLFQLNGAGMTKYLMDLRPTSIHDINAMVALYRPGPMESIPEYIHRKHNPKLIKYLDGRMKDILDQSYGVITYQDDVMLIAIKLGGYSWLETDKLRKAMGKKIPKEMEAQKEKLLKGFTAGGLSREKAEELWALIEPFAAYGFNKCLTADTRVLNAGTGVLERIDELAKRERPFSVLSLKDDQTLAITKSAAPFENGVTRSGRVIRATDNHPFLTFNGWKRLDKLAIGIRIAAPRKIPPPKRSAILEPYKATVLGYIISEGNLCHPHGVYFYSTRNDEIKDFISAAEKFPNSKMTLDHSKSAASVYVGQTDQKVGNSLYKWLKNLGLIGKTATEKFIPDVIFSADNDSLAVFLGKLWQGDGCASIKNQLFSYATSSRRLADDVAHLLLRFGIISTLHTKKFRYRGDYKTGWTVSIQGEENFKSFMAAVGTHLIGVKREAAETVLANSRIRTNNRGRGTSDTIPAEIFTLLHKEIADYRGTTKTLARKAGVSQRVLFEDSRKRGYTRDIVLRLASILQSEELKKRADSDIFWDEVKSIEPDGKEMTYDLTVPTNANFVANGLIVHNSHAASYGLVAYQTAYMKANFPSEYMAAILTAESGDVEKVSEIIAECKRMGIPVLPPDVNESMGDFAVIKGAAEKEDKIRFGLHSIKNLGNEIADAIIHEREKNDRYKSYADFLERVQHRNVTKKSLEALIKCGAMDNLNAFGEERGQMLFNMEESLAYNKEHRQTNAVQTSLFGLMESPASIPTLRLKDAPPSTQKDKLAWEKELLGLYISGHPLDKHREKLEKREWNNKRIKEEAKDGMPVTIIGIVEEMRDLMTKKNERMAFMKIADYHDSIEVVVFPRAFEANKEFLAVEKCLCIRGKFSTRNGDASVIADVMKVLD